MSQKDLAEKSGITVVSISQLETMAHPARFSTALKLAKALDVEPSELIAPGNDEEGASE
jgi:transcriptional regulator with XRE-family HTH domain